MHVSVTSRTMGETERHDSTVEPLCSLSTAVVSVLHDAAHAAADRSGRCDRLGDPKTMLAAPSSFHCTTLHDITQF